MSCSSADDVLDLEAEAYQVVAEQFDMPVTDVEQGVEDAVFWPFS